MILSDKQAKVSRQILEDLEKAKEKMQKGLEQFDELKQTELEAINFQIKEINSDLQIYYSLKEGNIYSSKVFSLEDLGEVLIQSRIARGWTQSRLARELGLKPQQIQRYESSNYYGASLERLITISKLLQVQIDEEFKTDLDKGTQLYSWRNLDDIDWDKMPLKELIERKYFELTPNKDPYSQVREWAEHVLGQQLVGAFHRKKVRGNERQDELSLIAWQTRIIQLAKGVIRQESLADFEMDDTWIPDLVSLTKYPDGPKKSQALLREHGIVIIIENHLPKTYLDGAAMLLETGHPVIGITLRYDRLDNYWFVLFHELGHVYRHILQDVTYDFFDQDDTESLDNIEREADRFALNHLISDELWDKCMSRFTTTDETVIQDAGKLGIDESIIAGRIRRERSNYKILNKLIGQGKVRSQFTE